MTTELAVPDHDIARVIALGAVLDTASGQLVVPTGVELQPFYEWLRIYPSDCVTELETTALTTQLGMSLSDLLARCGAAIKAAIPSAVWVRIEISQISANGGHLYFIAVERDGTDGREIAKVKAMIWKSSVTKLVSKFSSATGMELAAGIAVLIQVKPQIDARYGLSLQILDIDPSYTLGEREARLKQIRLTLDECGDSLLNKSLSQPDDFFHVGVISPAGAAGLDDFQATAQLLTAAGLCEFIYFEAVFQGDRTKASMKDAFVEAHNMHAQRPFDALVVIRGGGAAADLHWLDELLIARMVCRFHCPVLTGIGHERDRSLLDEYANRSFGTPSKVAAHIRDCIANKALQAHENWSEIAHVSSARLDYAASKSDESTDRLAFAIQSELPSVFRLPSDDFYAASFS